MSLKIGIVGLPNVGKSTLFKALTREKVNIANFPFATIDPNVGVVKVADKRLDELAKMSKSRKIILSTIEFVDIAGLVRGAYDGAGLGNQFLAHIREVDAILEVVRAFEDPDIIHVEGNVSPRRDIETVQLELAAADLQTVEKRLLKTEKELKSSNKLAQEQKIILEKIKNILEAGDLAIKANLESEELEAIKDLHLLTLKPFLFVFNSNNNYKMGDMFSEQAGVGLGRGKHIAHFVTLDLKFEAELSEMEEVAVKEFGDESHLDDLIKVAYKLLGLITYFTTGEDETRGWTIKAGSSAPEAGAAIHTDFKEKFIRAEVINWQKLLECGSWAAARSRGLLRLEGKDYTVQDGDVIEFKI